MKSVEFSTVVPLLNVWRRPILIWRHSQALTSERYSWGADYVESLSIRSSPRGYKRESSMRLPLSTVTLQAEHIYPSTAYRDLKKISSDAITYQT